jgi:hypothetical protein
MAPTPAVPHFCTQKRANRIISESGTTQGPKAGVATFRPSIAPSTEMAGVMTPSPYNRAEPKSPMPIKTQRRRVVARPGRNNASRASTPPSPRLSARIIKERYLNVMRKLRDQKISERTPRILSFVSGTPRCPLNASFMA